MTQQDAERHQRRQGAAVHQLAEAHAEQDPEAVAEAKRRLEELNAGGTPGGRRAG